MWVIFALLDPDPDSGSGSTGPIESGSNPDTNPDRHSATLVKYSGKSYILALHLVEMDTDSDRQILDANLDSAK